MDCFLFFLLPQVVRCGLGMASRHKAPGGWVGAGVFSSALGVACALVPVGECIVGWHGGYLSRFLDFEKMCLFLW